MILYSGVLVGMSMIAKYDLLYHMVCITQRVGVTPMLCSVLVNSDICMVMMVIRGVTCVRDDPYLMILLGRYGVFPEAE